MKTKILYRVAIVTAFAGVVFVACNKSNSSADNGSSTTDLQTQSDDQTRVSNEVDATADDANTAMLAEPTVSGSSSAPASAYGQGIAFEGGSSSHVDSLPNPICDATIKVDTIDNPRTITITYNGNNCNGTRTRTGVVVISIAQGVHWRDQGAVVTLSIQNLKITRLIDNKSITLNGTHTYTNVSGGSLLNLPNLSSITHTITSSNMSVTFDNNTQRTWQVARQRVYTWVSQAVVITTSGTHSDGNVTGISEWGTNRFGNSFETAITTPLVIQQACSWRLTSGAVEVIRPDVTVAVTFGLDASGNPTGCPDTGTYYFKIVWEGAGGKTYTFILPY
jgi:hypothetical protein